MEPDYYPGKRLSYSGDLCTVRYVGEVKGTKGLWLGVEWDDPTRGKHSGEHGGVRYFRCQSDQPKAGSFIRTLRAADQPLSFIEALHKKYAPESEPGRVWDGRHHASDDSDDKIEISGKVVEEVGFEKIRKLLADLHELRIVLLDGLCIGGLLATRASSTEQREKEVLKIQETCPKIRELDLSLNLFEDWQDIAMICSGLKNLQSLKLTGTRFNILDLPTYPDLKSAFQNVKELSLDETLLSWLEICTLCEYFPSLTTLSASSNNLTQINHPLPTPHLTTLTLDSNGLTALTALSSLSTLPHLSTLSLKLNSISSVNPPTIPFSFPHVSTLTLSRNAIPSFPFISALPSIFPSLTSLLTSHNPLYDPYTIETAHMLTVARLPSTLQFLNYSSITPRERENAELYYLGLIGKELALVPEDQAPGVIAQHPRYAELVELYGPPTISREGADASLSKLKPGALAHRLIDFTFYVRSSASEGSDVRLQCKIPKTWDTYRVKGAVYRLFRDHSSRTRSPPVNLRPMQFRLIWETGEWDPIFGAGGTEPPKPEDKRVGAEESGSMGKEGREGEGKGGDQAHGKWLKRETELIDSTRAVGFWFDDSARSVKVRVEPFV